MFTFKNNGIKIFQISLLILFASILTFSCTKPNTPDVPPTANAGANQTIQLPANSFTLIGTGTTTNGSITGYLWSLVSGPNVPVITQPASATTTVTGFVAGTYVFQLRVTDNLGLTGLATTTITVNPAPIQTLTLQPTNNTDERHLFGNSTSDASGYTTEIDAATWTVSGSTVYVRGLVKFDFSTIPIASTILTAKLSLYSNPNPLAGNLVDANSGPNNAMYIRRVSNSWVPASTNWASQPASTATNQVSIAHTSSAMLDLIDVDVKNLVVDMRNSGNYGFIIQLQNESPFNIRDFCSSRNSNASKHPKLVITYQ